MSHPNKYSIEPIGVVHSCYREKFGIPRQPGLVDAAKAVVELYPEYAPKESVQGLEDCSHIWIIFLFHKTADQGWKPQVRPPRLGGNVKRGLYATRSMFRPNPIGQSLVKLDSVEVGKVVKLNVSGIDLLDKTPVIDIKPYIPYAENISDASAGEFQQAPMSRISVSFADNALSQLEPFTKKHPELKLLIEQVLAQDPRPAYHNEEGRQYGVRLHDLNICWVVDSEGFCVTSIEKVLDEKNPHQ